MSNTTGLLFFCVSFCGGRNSILADEMGLGKTVQSVMFANHLFQKTSVSTKKHLKHVRNVGQFLIVAPLSVIPHWKREFDAWTNMNAVIYHGNAESRKLIEQYVCGAQQVVDRRWWWSGVDVVDDCCCYLYFLYFCISCISCATCPVCRLQVRSQLRRMGQHHQHRQKTIQTGHECVQI